MFFTLELNSYDSYKYHFCNLCDPPWVTGGKKKVALGEHWCFHLPRTLFSVSLFLIKEIWRSLGK